MDKLTPEEKKRKKAEKDKRYRDKHKEGIAAQKKKWQEENSDAIKARSKEYRIKNKERLSAANLEYKAKNKEIIKIKNAEYNSRPEVQARQSQYGKDYRAKINSDPDLKTKHLQQKAEYREKNRLYIREYARKWESAPEKRAKKKQRKRERWEKDIDLSRKLAREYMRRKYWSNPEKAREYARKCFSSLTEEQLVKISKRRSEWHKRNPEYGRSANQNRRAAIKLVGGRVKRSEVLELIAKQRHKCAACKDNLRKGYHMDHVMPIALGGVNKIENIQLLCPKCNRKKHDKHPDEWAKSLGRLFV